MLSRRSLSFPFVLFALTGLLACSDDSPPNLAFEGLSDDVEVIIDDRGIPHIYAANDVDLMYAAGYQVASDRMFQMDLMRRRAFGRRAEVLGESVLGDDQLIRRVNIPALSRLDVERMTELNPELRRMLEAWVAGVNTRIREVLAGEAPLPHGFGPEELDYEPELWEATDAWAVGKLILFGNGSNLEFDILATALDNNMGESIAPIELPRPAYPAFAVPPEARPTSTAAPSTLARPAGGDPIRALDAEAVHGFARLLRRAGGFGPGGSNNWAVAGEHTDNGRPLIAGDPHQPLDSPSVFYAHHLNSKDREGTLDVAGFSFVGAPLVHLGRTDRVVWTATTNFADQMDLWTVQPASGDAFDFDAILLGGEEVPVEKRTEVFRVRQFDDMGRPLPQSMSEEVEVVMNDVPEAGGVILDLGADLDIPEFLVTGDPTAKLFFRWVGMEATTDALAWLGYNRAESVDDVEAALDEHGTLTSFNWIAADVDDISYRVRMDIPDRDLSQQPVPTRVLDGNDTSSLWTGDMLPPSQLPDSRNPARGWLGSANNDPWGFTADGDITNDPWYYGGFYAPGFRANRIYSELERLIGEGPVTPQQMQQMQLDVHSTLADEWIPVLQEAWSAVGTDPDLDAFTGRADLQTLIDDLAAWDRDMSRGSSAALTFHLFTMFFTGELLGDDIGNLFYPLILNADGPFTLKLASLAVRGEYPDSADVVDGNVRLLALRALDQAAIWLTDEFGGVDPAGYTWADAHGNFFDMAWNDPDRNRLIQGFVPTRGGEDTVNPATSEFFADDEGSAVSRRFESSSGPVYRMVAGFRENGRAEMRVNFAPGNVADPDGEHFDDTLEPWVEGQYSLFPFERSEVEAATESTRTLPEGMGAPADL